MERSSFGLAWVALCLALLVHVIDEALTNFLSVYNPTVIALRDRVAWLPLPVFEFGTWFGGLIGACLLLLALAPFAFRGSRWLRPIAYAFAAFMIGNAVLHTTGTIAGRTFPGISFERPMPGFYSSPFLFAASVYLLMRLRATRPTWDRHHLASRG